MMKGNVEAIKIEVDIISRVEDAMKALDDIHTWHKDVDRDILWEIRARIQDALRALYDEKGVRELKVNA